MAAKKIVCLGGGSLYFGQVLANLVATSGLAGSEVTLYDLDREKAEIMAQTGARLAREADLDLRVRACAELADAVDGADFAVSSIGGGGATSALSIHGSPYHQVDLTIPARYGIYQIVGDTGGPAALMMALRTISIYLDIAAELEKSCPDVIFINHSNPMAPLCRALHKHTRLRGTIGLCHGVQNGIVHVSRILQVPPEELETVWIGTNHYYWFTRLRHRGRDVYPDLWRRLAELDQEPGRVLSRRLSEIYGYKIVYPQDDHIVEFYPYLAQAPDPKHLPYGLEPPIDLTGATPATSTRASDGDPARRRQAYLAELRAALDQRRPDPADVHPIRGENVGRLIEAIATGRRVVHIVNVPNRGAVPNLPDYAVLEVEGVTDSQGVRPIVAGEAPINLAGLLQKRIAWQELVADAAATGDRRLALQALLLDEMTLRPEQAELMLGELLSASKPMLARFF
jgi:alpha-galactosidase